MRILLLLALLPAVFAAGCTAPSMNLQRAGLRGAADAGVTATLDALDPEAVETGRFILGEAFAAIRALAEENILSLGALRITISEMFPPELQPIGQAVLAAVEGVNIPAEKLGPDNIARVLAVVNGGEQALALYRMDHRPPQPEPEPETPAAAVEEGGCLTCPVVPEDSRQPEIVL